MADRVPLPVIAGLLTGFVGVDRRILTLTVASRLDVVLIGIRDAGSADVVAEVRSGGAAIATATITAGQTSSQATLATPVELAAGAQLDLRVTSDGTDAMTLDGWVELLELGDQFTTLARVKRALSIVDTESDAVLTELIASVTERMRQEMGREITTVTRTLERYSHRGKLSVLETKEWPLQSVSEIQVFDEVVTDYDTGDVVGAIYYGPAGVPTAWPAGERHIQISYTAGYPTVPEDLGQAATVQVVWDFKRRERTGERSSLLDEGNVVTYLVDAWAPEVVSAMTRYRRVEVPI